MIFWLIYPYKTLSNSQLKYLITNDTIPLNVAWVTVKQWYKLLLEKEVNDTVLDSPAQLIPTKLGVDFSGP